MTPGTCRYCGCTEDAPCDGGCGWTDEARTLCTWCAPARAMAQVLQATAAGRPELLTASLDADQSPLVMIARGLLDAARDLLRDGDGPDVALAALEDLRRLAAGLEERFPAEALAAATAGTGPVDLALQLLPKEPQRIVLASHL